MNKIRHVGSSGEARVLHEFLSYGVPVSIPFDSCEKYDMIAEFGGKLNKIQVKTTGEIREGCVYSRLCSKGKGSEKLSYDGLIDYFVIYSSVLDECAIIHIDALEKDQKSLSFRLIEPKRQGKHVKYWYDYRLFDFLENLEDDEIGIAKHF